MKQLEGDGARELDITVGSTLNAVRPSLSSSSPLPPVLTYPHRHCCSGTRLALH